MSAAYRAFRDWTYKVVKQTKHPYIECRHATDGRQPILYVAIGDRIKNKSTAGVRFGTYAGLDASLEDILEWAEVVKLARDTYKES